MAKAAASSTAKISRKTKETDITVEINLDGTGKYDIKTGIGFFDHMLDQLSRHSLIDMKIRANGDLHIDAHHTVEDTGIVLGQAIAKALGDRAGINRYASIDLAMDETLTRAALDVSGRPFLIWQVNFSRAKVGDFDTELFREFFQAFSQQCRYYPACDQSLWRKQPPYCRDLFQGRCPGACARRWKLIRARRALFLRPRVHSRADVPPKLLPSVLLALCSWQVILPD